MRKSKKQTLVFFLSVSLFAFNNAFAQTSMNLKQAIDLALANNSSLRSDSLEISVTQSKNKELAGQMLPQVTYIGGTEYNPAIASQMVPGSLAGQPNKDYVPVPFGSRYNMRMGVDVNQTIFRKDLQLQIRNSGLQKNIVTTKYNLSKEGLIYQVASTFYSLQGTAELIRNTYSDYLNLKDVLKIAKAQYENGIMKRIDYESLDINVANKESYLNQLNTQYKDQLAYFNYLLGVPASTETTIENIVTANVDTFVGITSVVQREDIHLSHQLIESKEDELKRIRAEKLPVVKSYFRYFNQAQFNDGGKVFNSDYWFDASTIGITVSLNIFDGNRRKSRMSIVQTQLEQLKLQSDYQHQQANMELFTATQNLKNNQQQYITNKNNLALAERVFMSRKALYTEGITTLVELLNAETELNQSRNLYTQSMVNVQTGWLDAHKANGTLLTEFVQSF
jgi:outer membrane protein TolC